MLHPNTAPRNLVTEYVAKFLKGSPRSRAGSLPKRPFARAVPAPRPFCLRAAAAVAAVAAAIPSLTIAVSGIVRRNYGLKSALITSLARVSIMFLQLKTLAPCQGSLGPVPARVPTRWFGTLPHPIVGAGWRRGTTGRSGATPGAGPPQWSKPKSE